MAIKTKLLPYHKVYIGMPVYNGEQFLEESIRSNLSQEFDDFGLIIADNASTDRTPEICCDYAKQDSRIYYIRNDFNLGAAKNYTCCFEPANSEYFRWANGDDLADPSLVKKCVQILDENPDCVLTYGKTNIIDKDGHITRQYDDNLHLDFDSAVDRFKKFFQVIGLSNVLYGLMRRKPLAHTALLGNYTASDINLIGELTLYGKFFEIPEFLFSRRMHEQASSWDRSDEEKQKEFWDPAKKKFFLQTWRSVYEYYRAVIRSPIRISEKAALYAYLTRHAYWQKNTLFAELPIYLKHGLLK